MPSSTLRLLLPALAVVLVLPVLVPSTAAEAAAGRTLHVDAENGSDPSSSRCQHPAGTAERPWRTLHIALRCLQAGDTLHVHAGTYDERVRVDFGKDQHGTPDAPIVVRGAPDESRPVIRGGLRLGDPTHWIVQGLEIVGDGQEYRDAGFHPFKVLGGTGWVVRDVEVHRAPTTGLVRVEPSASGPPTNWTIRDSCIHDTAPSGGGPYEDHNLYVWTGDGSHGGVIEGNVVFGAPNGQNIKIGNRGGEQVGASDGVTVRFNTLVDAVQNISMVGDSNGVLIERNLLAGVRRVKEWYPSVRGLWLSGTGNLARANAWSGSAEAVLVWTSEDHQDTGSIREEDNRHIVPDFAGTGCDGYRHPRNPAATAYGAAATGEPGTATDDIPVERIYGADRVLTAVEVSQDVHASADVAVLARADDYPDALASAALAGLVDAPVLLSQPDRVPEAVMAELRRLQVDRVLLLGGANALGTAVVDQLRAAQLDVARIHGENRFATATAVADEARRLEAAGARPWLTGGMDEVILVEGANPDPARGWPDAVAAGQLAAATGAPVLLTTAGSLPAETREWLRTNRPARVTIVGGGVAVSPEVEAEVGELVGTVRRLAGALRFDTAQLVAEDLLDRASGSGDPRTRTFVASGLTFPDALTAGPAAAASQGVLLLYGTGYESYERVRDFTALADAELVVGVVGGPAAVPTTLEDYWRAEG